MVSSRNGRLWALVGLIVFASTPAPRVLAQLPRREPTPNDTLQSTQVTPDHTVTFRIYAPKASDVFLSGDFGAGGRMTKDEAGVWSLTVGPLAPDFYVYAFTVDGVRTVDPKNPLIKQGFSGVDSMFEVAGEEMDFEATKDVPHGEIRAVWYRSRTLGMHRRMHIYTPPGYEGAAERYPVFYLLHGGGDDDSGWSTIGRAGFILDNLIAARKAVPMLVVMPNGRLPLPANLPRFTPGAPASSEFRAAMTAVLIRFTDDLMNEVVPLVEKTYRVKTGPENRALAGLSMGGGQSLGLILSHPDQFAYVGIWSAGLFGANVAEWEERNKAFLAAAEQFNQRVKLFEISVGDNDFALAGSKSLAEVLEKHGLRTALHISVGGHTWSNWRRYLWAFAPRVFQ
jgi:enterochelin esterase family protein